MKRFVLCYVDGNKAYFTTRSLEKQWGDDWNDAPYEANAGTPYGPHDSDQEKWEIVNLYFDVDLNAPCDGVINSQYSVEMINKGVVPWLQSPGYVKTPKIQIYAGTPLQEFIKIIRAIGGSIYLDMDMQKDDL